jgi:hypothetical protein
VVDRRLMVMVRARQAQWWPRVRTPTSQFFLLQKKWLAWAKHLKEIKKICNNSTVSPLNITDTQY